MNWIKKHWEVLSYLIFGVMTTLLNIVLYAVCQAVFGYEAANSWGNVLDNVICILFAYATNRAFVFSSKTRGREAVMEFGTFVACRLGTLVLDSVIVFVGGTLLAAQGTALVESAIQSFAALLLRVMGYSDVQTDVQSALSAIGVIGGADGQTAVFVTYSPEAQSVWGMCVKVFSNVLVVVLNYVFSKLIIFKKK